MATQFMAYRDFVPSVKALKQKGGTFQKAGDTVWRVFGIAHSGKDLTVKEVFEGVAKTNHGESRIAHCVKYDLTGYARLVTAVSNGICIFLFAGDHDAVDRWLERNKGLDFIAREGRGAAQFVSPVFVSDPAQGQGGLIASSTDWMHSGPVLNLLTPSQRDVLLHGLDQPRVELLEAIESHTDEDEVLSAATLLEDASQADAVLDVLLLLRGGDQVAASARIDLYASAAKRLAELTKEEVAAVASSESTLRIQDVDPVLLEHYFRTAAFKDWMLYLHPAQREIATKDFPGAVRLAGVSGSGKTSVVIHRALRLARQNSSSRVLVLTLNNALARLITELVNAESGNKPRNLEIASVFQFCAERLQALEPERRRHYVTRTVVPNEFGQSEHIDDIWDEYFYCEANNTDADEMFEVVRTMNVRGVHAKDYLRQEFDYIRSAFSSDQREAYLTMERTGRVIGLERRYREMILQGLAGWERKMEAVGAIDDPGVVNALYRHVGRLQPEFDHVLVDEVQDLGTLELRIIRALTRSGANDLFLAGDAAQAVYTKYADLKAAGIDLPSARHLKLQRNYRNSRQILTAAHAMLTASASELPPGVDLEVLAPEFANFSSAKPLLLSAKSFKEELSLALGYAAVSPAAFGDRKACVAICGYPQKSVEELGALLNLPVLNDSTDLSNGKLFLSDLEQTKGFEFDLMILINCSSQVVPHPDLPQDEAYREVCKLYVALTRAKAELVVSYSSEASRFLKRAESEFNVGSWTEHEVTPAALPDVDVWPKPSFTTSCDPNTWSVSGKEFLRRTDAVGLSVAAQEAILSCVTGQELTRREAGRNKQKEWPDFLSFFRDMQNVRSRVGVISTQAWDEIASRYVAVQVAVSKADSSIFSAPSGGIRTREQAEPSQGRIFYRHDGVTSYSIDLLTRYTVASFLAAQGKSEVDQLEVGTAMRLDLLEFLVPRGALKYWLTKGWLRLSKTSSTQMALTKAGWDRCLAASAASAGVNPSIGSFLQTILTGGTSPDRGRFSSKAFAGVV